MGISAALGGPGRVRDGPRAGADWNRSRCTIVITGLMSDPSFAPVPTRYWHVLDDGRVQCDVCPRACKLREGQRGLCFVRGRENGAVVLETWGRSSGFC